MVHKKTILIFFILVILTVIYFILYYLNKIKEPTLNKKTAINLCKYVVTLKIDKNLNNFLVDELFNIKNKEAKVNLIYKHNNKTNEYTTAYCTFNLIYNSQEIWLKSFFYQDVKSDIYIYNNVGIKIKNIKTCALK